MVTWNAQAPSWVELHCLCGLSWDDEVVSGAQAFTAAWWQVHCGPGHGHSPVPVDKPTEADLLLVRDRRALARETSAIETLADLPKEENL